MDAQSHFPDRPCGFSDGQSDNEAGFSPSPLVLLSVSFHQYSIFTHVMDNEPVSGCSSIEKVSPTITEEK